MAETPSPSFDPRSAPLLGTDAHLPAVPPTAQTPQALRQRFAAPPRWQPEVVHEKRFSAARPVAPAAVLVPIVLRPQPTVLLTERSAHLSAHSGQIAFPGGKCDPQDASPEAAALRETWEEVGLGAQHVHILGRLPVYVTGTAFSVTPVVALVDADAPRQPNPHEVADIFEVPLAFLLDPAHHQRQAIVHDGIRREWFAMPWHENGQHQPRYIWGATAGMLRNLYRFLIA